MTVQDSASCYQAFASHDPRFDGVFFVGVTSTGIYCRPICPAKFPKERNCRFFDSAEAAEKARFRPCLRCRPELAPGNAPVDESRRVARQIVQAIEESLGEEECGLEDIAERFGLSSRQIRRIVQGEFGVSPIELIQTRRLLLAKQLLTETKLPVTEIAFASGFASLRRFNDAFSRRYGMPPSRLRKQNTEGQEAGVEAALSLRLTYRPPYEWNGLLSFLRARMLKGAEAVTDEFYARTVRLGRCKGWLKVRHAPAGNCLIADVSHTLTPVLPAVLSRLRNVFDLSARPDLIAGHFERDALLGPLVRRNPGLRVPGSFDGFELAVRAILGQQVTVKAATTLAGRFAEAFGERIETPVEGLRSLAPAAKRVAKASVDEVAGLGIVGARARSIIALGQEVSSGALRLEAGTNPDKIIAQLAALPGIGQWTAHYIAMRALRWPDAFPKEDIAIRNNLGGRTAKEAEEMSQAWRPWRSYAVLHIWQNPGGKAQAGKPDVGSDGAVQG